MPGKPVRYGIFESPLGNVVVAATAVGVCAVAFAESAEILRAELEERLPRCSLCEDAATVAPFARALLARLSGAEEPHLPLDVEGTAFQRRVWEALRAIPRGMTQTYTQVAQALGLPTTAARAVAQACASNPVALAIPCHRVVAVGGDLRGYRWGMERKRQLLLLERTPT